MRAWKKLGRRVRSRFVGLLATALCLIGARVEAATLTWDAGNTTNGSTIDPGSGTWDLSASVWNNATVDVPWTQTSATAPLNSAVFKGADGTYAINLGADVSTS